MELNNEQKIALLLEIEKRLIEKRELIDKRLLEIHYQLTVLQNSYNRL